MEVICPENDRETVKQVYSHQSSHNSSGHSDTRSSTTVELIDARGM